MFIIFIFIFAIFWYVSIPFRLFCKHPFKSIKNGFIDFYRYFRYKQYNNMKTGQIVCYVGLFGKGKTLSAVHKVVSLYNQYNNKMVYDKFRKKYVKQRVNVYSNVKLQSIPYIHFTGLQQLVDVSEQNKKYDEDHNTLTCSLFLGDEFSVEMNNRNFKTNIDPLVLNTILTCRHHHISLFVTSQRFHLLDALLRQVTSYVVDCNKSWRFMTHRYYDAWELENAQNSQLIKSLKRSGFFITNEDYESYDTLATVDTLIREVRSGNMLKSSEILQNQGVLQSNMDVISNPSRKYISTKKKYNK